jgi:hypothetical protein
VRSSGLGGGAGGGCEALEGEGEGEGEKECGGAQRLRWNERPPILCSGSSRRPTSKPSPSPKCIQKKKNTQDVRELTCC